jgi:hypothetical protein
MLAAVVVPSFLLPAATPEPWPLTGTGVDAVSDCPRQGPRLAPGATVPTSGPVGSQIPNTEVLDSHPFGRVRTGKSAGHSHRLHCAGERRGQGSGGHRPPWPGGPVTLAKRRRHNRRQRRNLRRPAGVTGPGGHRATRFRDGPRPTAKCSRPPWPAEKVPESAKQLAPAARASGAACPPFGVAGVLPGQDGEARLGGELRPAGANDPRETSVSRNCGAKDLSKTILEYPLVCWFF